MKNVMLALVVLLSAISIGWAIHQPEKAVASEEESGSSEIVLQVFSESEYLPYESAFTDFSSLDGVSIVNIVNDKWVLRTAGTLSSSNIPGVLDYTISNCGDCSTPGKNPDDGVYVGSNCFRCALTALPSPQDLGDFLVILP